MSFCPAYATAFDALAHLTVTKASAMHSWSAFTAKGCCSKQDSLRLCAVIRTSRPDQQLLTPSLGPVSLRRNVLLHSSGASFAQCICLQGHWLLTEALGAIAALPSLCMQLQAIMQVPHEAGFPMAK